MERLSSTANGVSLRQLLREAQFLGALGRLGREEFEADGEHQALSFRA